MAACLENIIKTDEIAFYIGIGIGDRVANSGLSGEIDNNFGLEFGKYFVNQLSVSDISFDKLPFSSFVSLTGFLYAGKTKFLDAHIIVIVQIIYAEYV